MQENRTIGGIEKDIDGKRKGRGIIKRHLI
jgi:hypothetical protein